MSSLAASATPLRIAVLGVSTTAVCGVRDHATLLTRGLAGAGEQPTMLWLDYEPAGLAGGRRALGAWVEGLPGELERSGAQAILLHYSVFGLSHRGVPVFVHPLLARLKRTGLPLVTIVHEAVYPWNIGGARGKLWAFTQRVALIELVRRSSGLLVTASFREQWLAGRRWLPRRPIETAPVFSNLPAPGPGARDARSGQRIGVFGYAYEGAGVALVLDALAAIRRRLGGTELVLLGAPGADSPAGREWRRRAEQQGLAAAVHFSGTLTAAQLTDALAACDVLLSINSGGPSSRKGSLAGSLGSGAPVVALDGPHSWRELAESDAIRVVPSDPRALAEAVLELLEDPAAAQALGERGRAFAEQRMSVSETVRAVEDLLERSGAGSRPR